MTWLKISVGLMLLLPSIFVGAVQRKPKKPNIVMIMADDLGFHDVGFHGSDQIPTPNIDALGAYGIYLNRYYVAPMCSPSRSSLMTGKYPSTVGMQKYVITPEQPFGLSLCEKILPEYLKEAGYKTHIVGKWHLGYHKKEYTPTFRGFDSHIGYLGAMIDFYNHSLTRGGTPYVFDSGYDMRKNLDLYYETKGVYATDLFTQESETIIRNHNKEDPMFLFVSHLAPHAANFYEPLQAPQEAIDRFYYIKDVKRRKYAAMVSIMDDGIGKVVKALSDNDLLDNTIIVFFSDNGAPVEIEHRNAGSNTPLRGQKESPWEGAVRSAAVIWSPLLKNRERTSDQLFHISDWLPTFAGLAGVPVNQPIDGKDIWGALSENRNNPRKDALLHLDYEDGLQDPYNHDFGYQSYISGDYKYVNSSSYNGSCDRWMDYVDESEKHPSFATYGQSIIDSPAGQALAKYSVSRLRPSDIEKNRRKAILTCNNVPIPTERKYQCFPMESPCLFNIVKDPCERRNIASEKPCILKRLASEVEAYRIRAPAVRNKRGDPRSNPGNFNNTWTWWFDELGVPDFEENRLPCKLQQQNPRAIESLCT